MTSRARLLLFIVVATTAVLFAGCPARSMSPRFYTLTPVEAESPHQSLKMSDAVAIGPVTIPDHLNRPQIVTRRSGAEIVLAEFDRWGGPFDQELNSALVANVAHKLHSRGIAVFPWNSPLLAGARTVTRIRVDVLRFDAMAGERVVLAALWTIAGQGDRPRRLTRQTTLTENVEGNDYEALVAAMGRSVKRLGDEIADGIVSTGTP